ncbi:glycine betaine/L-proline transporter ProP [Leifsonia kafniensis]|uniref:Glycine betaine/L-proline transporter ProP n=2 Tax=Leifsonia kafniensis TaxID=475957 RepID=A0ABP7KZP6_9MICO
MEWYDFGVYAYLATTLARVFFPPGDIGLATLASLGAFTAAFLVRPIGGAILGPLGDKIGRRSILALTMIVMAIGTLAIGLIPDYATIGIWAPILLLICRLVQGFSAGGEYGGAATFIAEYSTDRRRGYAGSWLEFGTLSGYVLGAVIVTVIQFVFPEDVLLSWAWRIPFLLAGPLGLIGLYLRLRLEETPAFKKQQQASTEREQEKTPFARLFAQSWRPLLVCVGLVLVFNVSDYMLLTYMPTYLTGSLGRDAISGLLIIIVVMVMLMTVMATGGRLSDRFGRKPMLYVGCIGFFVLSWPALKLIQSENIVISFSGLLILGLILVTFMSTMPATLPALFPTVIRYGALAIAFNVSVSLFGGTTPLVTDALVQWATDAHLPFALDIPAFYLMAAALIGAVAVFFTPETAQTPLMGSGPAVASIEEGKFVMAQYANPESDMSQSDWGQDFASSHDDDEIGKDHGDDGKDGT